MKRISVIILLLSTIGLAVTPSLTSFNAGQVSPLFEARTDFEKYNSACRTLENMFVVTQGPATKRPGTEYITEVGDANYPYHRLIPFEYSEDDAYVIELGHLYARFYRNGGQILDVNSNPYQLTTPFAGSDLYNIQYAQADNSMYLVDGVNPPQMLSRTAHDAWTIADVNFTTGPFMDENTTTTTVTPSDTTGDIVLSTSGDIFNIQHIGALWAINQRRGTTTYTGATWTLNDNESTGVTASFQGTFSFTTSGTWSGTVTLQRSTDGGSTWQAALVPLNSTNFANVGESEAVGAIYRATMSDYSSGTCYCTFIIADAVNYGVVKITGLSSGKADPNQLEVYTSYCVAHLPLDDDAASSTVVDNIGADGTLVDGTNNYTQDVSTTGQRDTAFDFDGTENVVSVADRDSLDLTTQMTIMCWFKADTVSSAIQTLVGKRQSYSSSVGENYMLALAYDEIRFSFRPTGKAQMVYTTDQANIQAGRWYHLAAVYKRHGTISRCTIYLGSLETDGGWNLASSSGAPPSNAYSLYIGGLSDGYYFNGVIDDVYVFNSALEADDITDILTSSASGVTATVLADLYDTNPTTYWREGSWSDYRGWPKTITFHQQRMIFGGSRTFPSHIWFGKCNPDDYENFDDGTDDTASFTVGLQGSNMIQWLLSEDYLLIGTSAGVGKYGEPGAPVTPTSPIYREQARIGCATLMGQLVGDHAVFVERGSQKVRAFAYSLQQDKYTAPELTILAPDIARSGIKDITVQNRPDQMLWCVLNDGNAVTLTYRPEQAVAGWAKQHTEGYFKSICAIPGTDEDEVWAIVLRDVNGTDTYFVEQFQPRDWGTDPNDAWYVDCGLKYDSTAVTRVTGMDHLIGETVQIWAGGLIQPDDAVEPNGTISLSTSCATAIAGLGYTAKLETLPLSVDPQDKAMNKRIKTIAFDFYETGDCKYGNGANSDLTSIEFYNNLNDDPNLTSTELYTSTVSHKKCTWPYGSMQKQTVYLESSEPVPLTIRSITPELEIK